MPLPLNEPDRVFTVLSDSQLSCKELVVLSETSLVPVQWGSLILQEKQAQWLHIRAFLPSFHLFFDSCKFYGQLL